MKMNTRFGLFGLSVCVVAGCGKTTPPTPAVPPSPPFVAEKAITPHLKADEKAPPQIPPEKTVPLADDPKNIEGYGQTRWGMTEKEVLMAEAQRVERLDEPIVFHKWTATLGIKMVEIEYDSYEVLFLFDDTDHKLAQVNLKCLDENNQLLNGRRFVSLEKLLTEKYGPPTFATNGKGESNESNNSRASWKLAKTTVELRHSHSGGFSDLTVIYRPVEASKKASNDL